MEPRRILSFLFVCTALLLLWSCGGGGGGGGDEDYQSAAEIDLNVVPNDIDPGDRSLVTMHVGKVRPEGLLLKIRYPLGVVYVAESGRFERGGLLFTLTPALEVADDKNVYLLFLFNQSDFGPDGQDTALLQFEIRAVNGGIQGAVEADPVIREPGATIAEQFDIANPLFGAKESIDFTVSGTFVEPTATPTPAPSATPTPSK